MARKSKSQTEGSHSLSSAPLSVDVHPAANIFPMMDDDQLASLADSIGRNGLRHPIVRWVNGGHDILIDGRNRFRACELAGVEPQYESLEGDEEDVLAYIADANLMRRDLKQDQKIMALALIYREPGKRGRGNKLDTEIRQNLANMGKALESNRKRLNEARALLKYEDLYKSVLGGTKQLYKAYEEARKRDFDAQSDEAKLAELAKEAPDIAEMVPDRLSLEEALAAWEKRKTEEAERLKSLIHAARVAITESARHLFGMSHEETQASFNALLESDAFLKEMSGLGGLQLQFLDPEALRAGAEYLIQITSAIKGRIDGEAE